MPQIEIVFASFVDARNKVTFKNYFDILKEILKVGNIKITPTVFFSRDITSLLD